jgi:hypothetical protein
VFDLVLHSVRIPLTPETHALGGGLTVGCHPPPKGMPPTQAVMMHAASGRESNDFL